MSTSEQALAVIIVFCVIILSAIIGLIGLFWIAYGETEKEDTIENYKDCMESKLPAYICEIMYPPLKIQSVNWSIPFP